MYAHSNELEEIGVISLSGVNVESDPQKEMLLGVRDKPNFDVGDRWTDLLVHRNPSRLPFSQRPTRTQLQLRIRKSCSNGRSSWILHVCQPSKASLSSCLFIPVFLQVFVIFLSIHTYLSIYERYGCFCCSLRCPRCFLFCTDPFPRFIARNTSKEHIAYVLIGDSSRIPSNCIPRWWWLGKFMAWWAGVKGTTRSECSAAGVEKRKVDDNLEWVREDQSRRVRRCIA